MIVTAISFSQSVSAIDFTFEYPSEAESGQEITVSIFTDETEEDYDVKIYIHQPIQEYSEIFDGSEWKRSHFYLIGVFPEQKSFLVRSNNYIGETEICVQLRKNGQTNFDKVCNQITVVESLPSPDEQTDSDSSNSEEQNNQEETIMNENNNNENLTNEQISNTQNIPLQKTEQLSQNQKKEKIILNSPDEEKVQVATERKFISSQEKQRTWVIYAFIAFSVLLAVLIALRKL